MRLINCKSLQLEEFHGSSTPRYAILSHTWASDEVSFTMFNTDLTAAKLKTGFCKIDFTCQQAIADGLKYAWVDTACIDKSSSAELSEAINSMYNWYEHAFVCYAYLADVTSTEFAEQFPKSRWFQRGWTLQELIAPNEVVFFDSAWNELGNKKDLAQLIHKVTQIDEDVLTDNEWAETLRTHCVAKRMAWASRRTTTRIEDTAYCLLGIFEVNMPLLYGEGRRAFHRLQQEIMKVVDDDSILAWGRRKSVLNFNMVDEMVEPLHDKDDLPRTCSLFAASPWNFANCHDISYSVDSVSPYAVTNQGLDIEFPLIRIPPRKDIGLYSVENYSLGLLTCKTSNTSALLGILLADSRNPSVVDRIAVHADDEQRELSAMTILVGPRLAAQAVTKKIIITNIAESSIARGKSITHQQILVDQSKKFQNLNYIATGGKALWFSKNKENKEVHYFPATWDGEASVFTVERETLHRRFEIFTFEASNSAHQCGGFSILIRGCNAIVRNGTSLSMREQRRSFRYLESHDQDTDEDENVVLTTGDGRKWALLVELSAMKIVHNWGVGHVKVDAIDVTGLPTTDVLAKRRRKRSALKQRRLPMDLDSMDDSQSSSKDNESLFEDSD